MWNRLLASISLVRVMAEERNSYSKIGLWAHRQFCRPLSSRNRWLRHLWLPKTTQDLIPLSVRDVPNCLRRKTGKLSLTSHNLGYLPPVLLVPLDSGGNCNGRHSNVVPFGSFLYVRRQDGCGMNDFGHCKRNGDSDVGQMNVGAVLQDRVILPTCKKPRVSVSTASRWMLAICHKDNHTLCDNSNVLVGHRVGNGNFVRSVLNKNWLRVFNWPGCWVGGCGWRCRRRVLHQYLTILNPGNINWVPNYLGTWK